MKCLESLSGNIFLIVFIFFVFNVVILYASLLIKTRIVFAYVLMYRLSIVQLSVNVVYRGFY